MGKGGSGPRSRRGERSGYVGPFDHPKKEQKTVESPLQRRVARRVRWRGCGNRRFVRGTLRRVPIQFKKQWVYLYRSVDSQGNTLDFFFSPTRDAQAAKQFLLKTLAASHTTEPRVINVDKNAAYPKAFSELKAEEHLPASCELRQIKYLNNLIEQDHRFIKRLTKPGMGFFSIETAWRTLQGYEIMNMMRKGQVRGVAKGDVRGQVTVIARLFGVAG